MARNIITTNANRAPAKQHSSMASEGDSWSFPWKTRTEGKERSIVNREVKEAFFPKWQKDKEQYTSEWQWPTTYRSNLVINSPADNLGIALCAGVNPFGPYRPNLGNKERYKTIINTKIIHTSNTSLCTIFFRIFNWHKTNNYAREPHLIFRGKYSISVLCMHSILIYT